MDRAWLMSVFRQSGDSLIGYYHGEDHEFSGVKSPDGTAWKSIAICNSSNNGVNRHTPVSIVSKTGNEKIRYPTIVGTSDMESGQEAWLCYAYWPDIRDEEVSMTARTGSDPSGPVQYRFTETSGKPGRTSSAWQTSGTYHDSGLMAHVSRF